MIRLFAATLALIGIVELIAGAAVMECLTLEAAALVFAVLSLDRVGGAA